MPSKKQQLVWIRRQKIIYEHIPHMSCLQEYGQVLSVLGNGSSGTVFLVCEEGCVAIKIQLLVTEKHMNAFTAEIENQRRFAPYAPQVLNACTEKVGQRKFGIIIMELLKTDGELDKYLEPKRSPDELHNVITGITEALAFAMQQRITHGDLALFNIAQKADGTWIFIDFDRSSTTVFAPHVDYLRLVTELYDIYRSTPTKEMHEDNIKYLLKHAVPVWFSLYDYQGTSNIKHIARMWEVEYEKYCKVAKVKCLD